MNMKEKISMLVQKFIRGCALNATNSDDFPMSRPSDNQVDLLMRFQLMVIAAHKILPEYYFKWPQMAWWNNYQFQEFLKGFDEDNPVNSFNVDRRWMLYQLIRLTSFIEGDTAECGVWKGASSWIIISNNISLKKFKLHYCIDSYKGLSDPDIVDGNFWKAGDLSFSMEEVKNGLDGLNVPEKYIKYCKGWIPDVFEQIESCNFSFVHIDVDLYQPTLDAMKFFYSKMSIGGIILCDDYGFTSCPGATKAIDEFLLEKSEKMISLSGGGGFMIKGTATGPSSKLVV